MLFHDFFTGERGLTKISLRFSQMFCFVLPLRKMKQEKLG
jgi:hypothetical protein